MSAAPPRQRTDLDLPRFERILEEERQRLLAEIENLRTLDRTGSSADSVGELTSHEQHEAEGGTELFLREQDVAIESSLETELTQVEAARRKLTEQSYGVCDQCGAEIPVERLDMLPFAVYCTRCADEIEARV